MTYNTLNTNIQSYLEESRLNGKSPNTIRQYRAGLKTLAKFMESRGLTELDKPTIQEYREHLMQLEEHGKIKTATLNAKGVALSGFLKYLDDPELREVRDIKINAQPTFKTCLTPPEYDKLLSYAKCSNYRYYLLCKFLGSTGLRISEALKVKVKDIQECATKTGRDNGKISVIGKGSKRRNVYVPKEIRGELLDYIKANQMTEGYIFASTKIVPNPEKKDKNIRVLDESKHISRTVAWKNITSLAKRAGIDSKQSSPHQLRHHFALSRLEELGGDMEAVRQVQKELGHSSIDTTLIYLETGEEHRD